MTAAGRLFLLFTLLVPIAQASDLAKEKRWADQTVDSLIDGEAVWLQAGNTRFLGIYTAAEHPTGRAALVIHGIGVHPNWPQVVYPLRTQLPADGWSTLALQMPVLPNEAKPADYAPLFDEVAPRIDAGIAFLEAHGAKEVVIVAHSLGAAMATHYLADHPGSVAAFVGIGMSGGAADPRMDNVQSLQRIHTPVLDLYGEHDLEPVVSSASARAAAAGKAENRAYTQAQAVGANHFFDGREDALVETVARWLDETVPAPSKLGARQ
jgi:pimeloyl-ACP methyl ester carboxylesterase